MPLVSVNSVTYPIFGNELQIVPRYGCLLTNGSVVNACGPLFYNKNRDPYVCEKNRFGNTILAGRFEFGRYALSRHRYLKP